MFVFVLICITLCSFCFVKDERADCLAFVVLRMSFYCKCYVALPHGTVSWSAVCSFLVITDHTHILLDTRKLVDFNLLRISPESIIDQNIFLPYLSKTVVQYFAAWFLIAVRQEVKHIDNSVVVHNSCSIFVWWFMNVPTP